MTKRLLPQESDQSSKTNRGTSQLLTAAYRRAGSSSDTTLPNTAEGAKGEIACLPYAVRTFQSDCHASPFWPYPHSADQCELELLYGTCYYVRTTKAPSYELSVALRWFYQVDIIHVAITSMALKDRSLVLIGSKFAAQG